MQYCRQKKASTYLRPVCDQKRRWDKDSRGGIQRGCVEFLSAACPGRSIEGKTIRQQHHRYRRPHSRNAGQYSAQNVPFIHLLQLPLDLLRSKAFMQAWSCYTLDVGRCPLNLKAQQQTQGRQNTLIALLLLSVLFASLPKLSKRLARLLNNNADIDQFL